MNKIKVLGYGLWVIGVILMSTSVMAQSFAQKPVPQMQSTSGMMYSGSNLPQAAATGATLAEEPRVQSSGRPGHIRRDGDPFGGETIGDVTNPNEPGTPIGDVFWPMMLLAGVYALMRVLLLNKRKNK